MQEIDLEEIKRKYPTCYSKNKHLVAKRANENYSEIFIKYKAKNGEESIHRVLGPVWMIKWYKIAGVYITVRKEKKIDRLYICFGDENDINSKIMITKICSKNNPYKTINKDRIYDFRNIITEFNPTVEFINKYKNYITSDDYNNRRV